MRHLILGTVATVVLASGCASLAPATCDPPEFDPPGRLRCDVVVAAAREQMADVAGVSRLEVLWGGCPPNARCVAPDGNMARVIGTIAEGRQVVVFVFIDAGGVIQADPPQLVVPSAAPPGG